MRRRSRAIGFDDFLNRQADGEAGAPFLLDHFGARALGAREQFAGQIGVPAGEFFQRQAGQRGARPDRHHAVAMFAQDQGLDLRGRHVELGGDQAAKADRVELRAQADHLAGRQVEPLGRQVGEHVDRVGHHQHDGVLLEAGLGDLAQDAQEQIDVAIDQVQPAFVGLAAQAGRDADQVAARECARSRRR